LLKGFFNKKKKLAREQRDSLKKAEKIRKDSLRNAQKAAGK
jgi:hypothetical protein